ncbi:ExbD/TolR family protein [Pseudophaeobacter flagellatus]|uniref:ExbD/TolR family protein n=1 Tax=Pseudophaeobacter flagellatus TaxID=2899119 RepID=UPI001E2E296E|nr:biopolymer transporter ExbD [Pseudophaeobacter flagellatus]MCD9149665.1 biopolymer transporter ExbD [Pseudophaeobacter flagellatus]
MQLARRPRPQALISLVPMIDVMLILLVFFMVTSSYLNLDMIPALRPVDEAVSSDGSAQRRLMIRLDATGTPHLRTQALSSETLDHLLRHSLALDPKTQLMILPSGAAPTQALISLMDLAASTGVKNMRVLQLEARP